MTSRRSTLMLTSTASGAALVSGYGFPRGSCSVEGSSRAEQDIYLSGLTVSGASCPRPCSTLNQTREALSIEADLSTRSG